MSKNETFREIAAKDLTPGQTLNLMTGGIGPRPIALVSTLSKDGVHNLAPFSFFNGFGCNPPIVVFSPAHRGRDGTSKDTYNNLLETKECVIQVVTYGIAEQVNLSSGDFSKDVDEFKKSGLTPVDSKAVKPKRVQESPFQMECHLQQMIALGGKPGSGNLAICEVNIFHIADRVFEGDLIHPDKIDLVGRNGGAYYTRSHGSAIFDIPKPVSGKIIGYDNLPAFIKESKILTANDLGRLGNVESIPSKKEALDFIKALGDIDATAEMFEAFEKKQDYENMLKVAISVKKKGDHSNVLIEKSARCALDKHHVEFAWKALVSSQGVK